MELFRQNSWCLEVVNNFVNKCFILDVLQGPEYTYEEHLQVF